jgi:RNA polymerase sigma-70 factor (ECF subfamily)
MADDRDSLPDDLLVVQCQQGDVASFESLVLRWQQPLLHYCWRLTGDWAAAQDAVQETWLVIIRGISALRDVPRFRAWLFRIASHKCQDQYRRSQSSQRAVHELQRQPQTAITVATANSGKMDLEAAFSRLPPESRTVLALMYLQDFSVGEMAEVLSLPEGTVKSRLYHARQQLRQLMEKDYGTH